MIGKATLRARVRQAVAALTCLVVLVGAAPGLMAQASTAAVAGVILDPSGKPAPGFKVILRDTASGKEFMSEPTDAQGNYSAQVPIGGRYKLTGVIASDGVTKLPVQDTAPVNVLEPGTTRLNVRFTEGTAPGAAPATTATTASAAGATKEEKKKKSSGAPWYKRPGPIVGMVLGGAAIVAIAASAGGGGGSDNVASASQPTDR